MAGIALAIVIVFGCASVVEWLVRRFLVRLLPRAPPTGIRAARLLFAVLALVIDALPIIAFAAAAYIVLPFTLPPASIGRTSLAVVVHATVLTRFILAVAKSLLLAGVSGFGVPLTEETRNYLFIWIKRFTCWGVFGFAFAEGAWWLGMPGSIFALTLKAVALVMAILAIVFVLQNRGPVREWIAGPAEPGAEARSASWRIIRRRLSEELACPRDRVHPRHFCRLCVAHYRRVRISASGDYSHPCRHYRRTAPHRLCRARHGTRFRDRA